MATKRKATASKVRKHGVVTPMIEGARQDDTKRTDLIGESAMANPWWFRAPTTRLINDNRIIRTKGIAALMDMRDDDQVKAALKFKKLTALSSGWHIEAPEELAEADDVCTKFVQGCLDDMPGRFDDALGQVLTALDFGFSVTEKVYEMQGILCVLKALKTRDPRPFQFDIDPYGNVLNIVQQGVDDKLPLNKFLVFTYQSEFGNPYGKPDLDAAYNAYFYKGFAWQYMMSLLERHGVPPFIIKYNAGAFDPGQIAQIQAIMKNLQAPTNAMFPRPEKDDLEIDFPEVAGQVATVFIPAIQECNQSIARALLMPGLMGMTSDMATGSLARSETHFDVFMLVVEELRQSLENAVQEQIIDQLCELNFPKRPQGWPQFKFVPMDDGATSELYAQWAQLVQANIVKPTPADEKVIRARFEMPERPMAAQGDYAPASPYAPQPTAQPQASVPTPPAAPTPQAPATGAEPLPTGGSGNVIDASLEGVTLNGAQVTAVLDVLAQLTSGTIQPDVAVALIAAVGVQEATAQGIVSSQTSPQALADAAAGKPTEAMPGQEGAPPAEQPLDGATDAGPTELSAAPAKRFEQAPEAAYSRPPIQAERKVNFAQMARSLDQIELDGALAISGTLRKSRDELERMVREDLADGQLDVVQNLTSLPYAEALTPQVNSMLLQGYAFGRQSVAEELAAMFTEAARVAKFEAGMNYVPTEAVNYLNTKAVTVAGTVDTRLVGQVKQELLSAITTGKPLAEIIQSLDKIFGPYTGSVEKSAAQLETLIRTNMTDAFNQGRLIQARKAEELGIGLKGYLYSAVIDARTTEVCQKLDGHWIAADDPYVDRLKPPRHFNCRSVLVPLTEDTGTFGATEMDEGLKLEGVALSGEGF